MLHPSFPRRGFSFLELLILLTVVTLGVLGFISGQFTRRQAARVKSCQQNLLLIDSAKRQFAEDFGKRQGDYIFMEDLTAGDSGTGYLHSIPLEPDGWSYTVDGVGFGPTCTSGIRGHSLYENILQ